jgi:hypothetical protein
MQDAHEFLNYLLNEMADLLEAQDKAARQRAHAARPAQPLHQQQQQQRQNSSGGAGNPVHVAGGVQQQQQHGQQQQQVQPRPTWVHEIFQVLFVLCVCVCVCVLLLLHLWPY